MKKIILVLILIVVSSEIFISCNQTSQAVNDTSIHANPDNKIRQEEVRYTDTEISAIENNDNNINKKPIHTSNSLITDLEDTINLTGSSTLRYISNTYSYYYKKNVIENYLLTTKNNKIVLYDIKTGVEYSTELSREYNVYHVNEKHIYAAIDNVTNFSLIKYDYINQQEEVYYLYEGSGDRDHFTYYDGSTYLFISGDNGSNVLAIEENGQDEYLSLPDISFAFGDIKVIGDTLYQPK